MLVTDYILNCWCMGTGLTCRDVTSVTMHYGCYTKLYTNAAIAPDQANQHMRKAGLGVFILEPRRKLMIHIKAIATANSVIMANADPRCILPYWQSTDGTLLQWIRSLRPTPLGHQTTHAEISEHIFYHELEGGKDKQKTRCNNSLTSYSSIQITLCW